MKEETVTKTVFIADDGKEFIDKTECEEYEKKVADLKKHMKYFKVMASPDLTETGYLQCAYFVAVYSRQYCHADIVENWCVKEMHWPILGESVQGYGFQRHFSVSESTEREYFAHKDGDCLGQFTRIPYMKGRYLLSPKEIDGYPEPFDYMKAWKFK